MQCTNNLKQFGLGLHNYHSAFHCFPGIGNNGNPVATGTGIALTNSMYSVHSHVLPYMEAGQIYEQIDFKKRVTAGGGPTGASYVFVHHLADLVSAQISVMRCPSDPASSSLVSGGFYICTDETESNTEKRDIAPTNYVTCSGDDVFRIGVRAMPAGTTATMKSNGLFYYCSSNSLAAVTDGTSNTMAMSETLIGDGSTGIAGSTYTLASLREAKMHRTLTGVTDSWINTSWSPDKTYMDYESAFNVTGSWDGLRGNSWLIGMPTCTTYGAFLPPNSNIPSVKWMNYGFYAARSHHTGGVNFLRADGSGSFASDSVDYSAWRAAATISGGEVGGSL